MTEEEAKESAVKAGKRKARDWDDETETSEWRSKMERKFSEMEGILKRMEKTMEMGIGRVLDRLQKVEDLLMETDDEKSEGKGADAEMVEEKEVEGKDDGDDVEMVE